MDQPSPAEPWKEFLAEHWAALLALLFGIGLRIWWFQGIGLNDDTEYADAAYRLASWVGIEQYALGSIDSIRFGMVVPVAAIYRMMGVSNVTSGVFPLICSSVTMWLTYLLGRALFSPSTGILALILLATLPLDIVYSTQLVPAVPMASCWAVSLLLLVTANRKLRHDSRRAGVWAALSGVALGVSWLCNESGPLFAIALVIWTVATGSSRKLLVLATAGALAVFVAECAVFRILSGSFWWRLNIIHLEEHNLAADSYPRALFRLHQLDFASQEGHFGLLAYLFLASFPALLWHRSRRALALWTSVLLIMLWFQYGIMTVEGRSIANSIRYLIVLLPFAALVCSEALLSVGRRGGHLVVSGLLGVVIATNLLSASDAQAANAEQLRDFKATADVIRGLPSNHPVFVGEGELGFLDVYLGKQRPLRILEQADISVLDDCFVVMFGSRGALENPAARSKTEDFGPVARGDWQEIATIRGADAGIFARFDPTIYYVPPRHTTPLRRLATITDLKDDVIGGATGTPDPPFVPDVVEAGISIDSERQMLEFEWTFNDPIPPQANGELGLVCSWRLTMDGSDSASTLPDFLVRLAWYPAGVGLFVDDRRPHNPFTFDDSCQINQSYRIDGASARVIIPIRCFREAGEEFSESSFRLKATFEAASVVNGRWIGLDIGDFAAIPDPAMP